MITESYGDKLTLDFFNRHYMLEGRQRHLTSLFKEAKDAPDSHITWNTKEVYHVDTILRDKWRVQLQVKYNLDFTSQIPNSLTEDLVSTLDKASNLSFMNYQTNGYPHTEVIITLTLPVKYVQSI